jgi:RNA polymerase sigma-70 factor, ECF subfamily
MTSVADPDVFAKLYDETLPQVYGYFLHRCGGRASAAEELTQETFVAAVAELRKGRTIDAPVPWLFGIARHKLLDHYRREGRRRELPHDIDEIGVEDSDERARVLVALRAVPAAQRAALVMRHMEGLSVPELAAVLGRSVEAAESLLARGRVHFKRAYLEEAS